MSYLSFLQLFNDFFLKNGAKFDTFSLIFEIQPPLLIRFSDADGRNMGNMVLFSKRIPSKIGF